MPWRLVFVVAATACGGSTAAPDAPRPIDAGPDAPQVDAATGGDPIGHWALRQVLVTVADAPVIGPTTTTTITRSVVDISADGGAFAVAIDPCGVGLESSSELVMPSLRPGYPATLPTRTVAGAQDGGNLVVALGIELSGLALANPATDPMPMDAADPSVRDDDADSQPGISVLLTITGLGVVEVYVAQRLEAIWRSTSLADDRISGALEVARFEQVTLGASNAAFTGSPAVAVQDLDSRFTLVRIPIGQDCTTVLAADEATLFGPR